ncbi:MAG: hypothetical protein K5876_00710 [Ruminiclostridium sp.]|nr:hypothetical protein [Ruminiclostridium sp.]
MDKKRKARGTHNEFPLRDEMALTGTVSTTDCTGLIPAGSADSGEKFDTANKTHKFSRGTPRGKSV